MAVRKPPRTSRKHGFSTVEMLLLLAVIALFLFGVIALTGRGLSSVQPSKGETEMNREATRLLDRVQKLVAPARAFLRTPQATRALDNVQLLFVADLDGSGGSVRLAQGGGITSNGMETVDIARSFESQVPREVSTGRVLCIRVTGDSPKNSLQVLTSMLDPTDALAFRVEYRGEDGRRIDLGRAAESASRISAVRVSVRLEFSGEARQFTRLIHLGTPARVMQAQTPR